MRYVADTNILLEHPHIINDYDIVICSHVLRELEKHESNKYRNPELAYRAREARRTIKSHRDKVYIDLKDYRVDDEDFDNDYEDNKILACCRENGFGLITKDILLQFKAELYEIPIIDVDSQNFDTDNYRGYKEIEVSENELAYLYMNMDENKYELLENQYLIIKLKDTGDIVDALKWKNGQLQAIKSPPKKVVDPKNVLQSCALDLLMDKSTPIKIIAGTYGSGKTFLNVKMALHHVLDKGNHSKIMVVRNPLGSGENIGYLKGTKEDKTQDFFKPFVQHLEGGEQEAFYLEQRGQLVKEIPYYIKGLSIDDSFVIVDEAEDLNTKMFKLIGTRLGENSIITFSGDFKQAEDKFIKDNGLKRAIERLAGHNLVGIVLLDEDVRSEASKVFADL